MQIDRQSLDRLLSLNDKQLGRVIEKLASDNGIDISSLNIDMRNIAAIRGALSSATDEDIARLAKEIESFRQNGGGGR